MKIFITLAILFFCAIGLSQTGINYKAVIKDGSGAVLANQSVDLQFIIYQGVTLTNNVYQETHSAEMTDANGLVVANIGEGSSNSILSDVNWNFDDHFLNVQINIGSGFVDLGTTQFRTVPYALMAESTANPVVELDDLLDARSWFFDSSFFLGRGSGILDDFSNNQNVGAGIDALRNNITGFFNTGIGFEALHHNVNGRDNTAVGNSALFLNLGDYNTAIGSSSLEVNTTGTRNTAVGSQSLNSNSTGERNTASGYFSLNKNTSGDDNTALGIGAMLANTSGSNNTAVGNSALTSNTTGIQNTAVGANSLESNTNGINNTAVGFNTLLAKITGSSNTAVGDGGLFSLTSGSNNTALGALALFGLTTGSNNIGIGNGAGVPNNNASNQLRIGNSAISYAGIQVAWTVTSDERWKDQIRDLPYGLDMVKQLRPVDYVRFNNEKQTREIGFVAQEIQELLAELHYDDQGMLTEDDKGYLSLRYNDLIPVLVKAIQEQQEIINSEKEKVAFLEAQIKQIEILDDRIRKIENASQYKR